MNAMTTDTTMLQRAVTALGRGVTAARYRLVDEHRVQAARLDPELPLGIDRDLVMVYAHGLTAVSQAGPDERAVLVRASYLLDHGTDPADVAVALAEWAARFPHLVGTAPRVHARTEHGWRAEPTTWAAHHA